MKKILLDTSTLLTPKSAIGLYTKKIAEELLFYENFNSFFLFNDSISKVLNFKFKKNLLNKILYKNYFLKYCLISSKIRSFIKKNDIDLFHQPNFISYDTGIKNLNNIHDFSWIHYPEYFYKEELKWYNSFFEKSLNNSFKVIVHSKYIQNELVKLFSFSKENIIVIHQDLQGNFSCLEENLCNDFLKKYNLTYKKFFLCINTLELRKNHKTLIYSYQNLNDRIKKNYPLVFFGMKGRFSNEILELIDKTENCFYYGYLDSSLVNQCYSSAKLFFYSSIYEGFGIPPLQSMASGTPVIASNIEAHREILLESCIFAETLNVDDWSINIKNLLDDQNLYNFYVTAGLNRSNFFKYGSTAKKVLNLYNEIIL